MSIALHGAVGRTCFWVALFEAFRASGAFIIKVRSVGAARDCAADGPLPYFALLDYFAPNQGDDMNCGHHGPG